MLCRLPGNLHFIQMPPGTELGNKDNLSGEVGDAEVLRSMYVSILNMLKSQKYIRGVGI